METFLIAVAAEVVGSLIVELVKLYTRQYQRKL